MKGQSWKFEKIFGKTSFLLHRSHFSGRFFQTSNFEPLQSKQSKHKTGPLLILKKKKLKTNSTRKLNYVLDTLNPNWFCPWSPFCCRGSLSFLKSTRWQRPWSKMHQIKKQTPLRKTNFLSNKTLCFIPRMIFLL